MAKNPRSINSDKLNQVVAQARQQRDDREAGYRSKSLKMYPWICGRCTREFTRENIRMLTVHHRDHNHDNNPEDGSNWELLCLYCHDNEHARYEDHLQGGGGTTDPSQPVSTFKAFADLASLVQTKK